MTLAYTRGKSSKDRLRIIWDHPSANGEARLDRDSALSAICGDDPRPLLVMRDCSACNGDDFAIKSRKLNNDRTTLLSHWFHCVRLPTTVLNESHPWHALFAGANPPHAFVATRDGKHVIPLGGRQSQRVTWRALRTILAKSYRKDPDAAVRKRLRLLTDYDSLDGLEVPLRQRLRALELEFGRRSRQAAAIRRRLDKLAKRRRGLEKHEAEILDLGLIAGSADRQCSRLLDRLRKQ